jgi:hypothetical protein
MTKEDGKIKNDLPDYFSPFGRVGKEAAEQERFPEKLLDIINIKDPYSNAVETVAVFACMGDMIDVALVDQVSHTVANQVQEMQVSKRDTFRCIEADEVDFFSGNGISQEIEHHGYNDPVKIYATIGARAKWSFGKFSIVPTLHKGILTSGRLDVLQAVLESQKKRSLFGESRATISQLTLPTRKPQHISKNKGIGIVYPIVDTHLIGQFGNVDIIHRIAFDILTKLKAELQADNHSGLQLLDHLPVPNRKRLEADLQAEGYDIHGNVAVKKNGGDPAQTGFLANLRKLLPEWNESKITLPAQGSAKDYEKIITRVIQHIASPRDQEAMQQVLARIFDTTPKRTESLLPPTKSVLSAASSQTSSRVPDRVPQKRSSKVIVNQVSSRKSRNQLAEENAAKLAEEDFKMPSVKKKVDTLGWEEDFKVFEADNDRITSVSTDWEKDFESISRARKKK